MQETCDTCHIDYAVTPANAKLALFISYPPANHVIATCGCGATEIIYMGGKTIMQLMDTGKFNIVLSNEPTPERREAANRTWGNARGAAAGNDLPQPPRAWLRQLHDDLRTFGNGSRDREPILHPTPGPVSYDRQTSAEREPDEPAPRR